MEIQEPPDRAACATCSRPLVWLWSAKTQRWVSFVPVDPETLRIHRCRELGEMPTWRQTQKADPPSAEYLQVRQQLGRES